MGLIYRTGPVDIVATEDAHLPGFWNILSEWHDFFSDASEVKDAAQFAVWFQSIALDALTGLDGDEVVGGAYLDHIYPGDYATVNIFKRRQYLNPNMTRAILKHGIIYWLGKYDLRMLIGITRHRHAARMARALGFRHDGILRRWAKVHGQYKDYALMSILKEEAEK